MSRTFRDYADGARNGVLLVQRCAACSHAQFALAGRSAAIARCRRCRTPDPLWVEADGAATLVSFTVVHGRAVEPGGVRPRAVAGIVELIEGPWVHGVVDAGPDDLVVGMPMRVGVAPKEGAFAPVPTFRPAG